MPPLRIQLAIQGGGAKFCALLAAAEGLQELEAAGAIEITRLAGTSAGSIAASILAAQPLPTAPPFAANDTRQPLHANHVAEHLRLRGMDIVRDMAPDIGQLKMWWNAYRGNALLDEQKLRTFLNQFFWNRGFRQFKHLYRPLFVMAADILNGQKVVAHADEEMIVDALANSCALPFGFRTFKNGGQQPIVDGGICENLPTDELGEQDKYGKVIAVSFVREPGTKPTNAKEFAMALLDTAMQNSMNRARQRIGDGSVYEIQTGLKTFDFEQAASQQSLGTDYQLVKFRTKEFFKNLSDLQPTSPKQKLLFGDPPAAELMSRIQRMFEAQHRNTPLTIERFALIVTANSCLSPEQQVDLGRLDQVMQVAEVRPGASPLYAFPLSLGSSNAASAYSVEVLDPNAEPIEFIVLPTIVPRAPDEAAVIRRDILVFFNPPLSGEGVFTIIEKDSVPDAMIGLVEQAKRDYLSITPRRTVPMARADLLLYAPRELGELTMEAHDPPGRPASVAGREMTGMEKLHHGKIPIGFNAFGFTTTDLAPTARFAIDFIRRPN